jgi:hypothetical protein
VFDSACLQYTGLLAEYFNKAVGVTEKYLWRLADKREADSIFLIGDFRTNSSVAY